MDFKFGRPNNLEIPSEFDLMVFPIIRRVFSRLLSQDLVSVEPMELPTGLLYYFDPLIKTFKFGR